MYGVARGVIDKFAQEAGRDGGQDLSAITLLRDLDGIEDSLYVGVTGTWGSVGLDAAEEREKRGCLVSEIAGGVVALGIELGAGMDGGQHAQRDDDITLAGQSDINASGKGEGRRRLWFRSGSGRGGRGGNARDGPEQAAKRNLGIVGVHQDGPAEGQRDFLEAVDDAMDDAGIVDVGDGDGVNGEQGNAQGAVFNGHGKHVNVAIALNAARVLAQVERELGLIVVADQNLRVAGCSAHRAAMHGHGGFVEIALKGKTRFFYELIVSGSQLGQRLLVKGGQAAHGPEIDIDHGISFREQACSFGSSFLAHQHDGADGDDEEHDTDRDDENASSGSHN